MIYDDIENIKKNLDEQGKTNVKVGLFGQPGAGKSSLINALTGTHKASAGVETDKTVEAKEIEHEGIIFTDLPGYGTTNFPKEGYFEKFNVLDLDLLLCVTSGKLRDADTDFFRELQKIGKVCLFVYNQSDNLWEPNTSEEALRQRKKEDIGKHVGKPVEVYFTSCKDFARGQREHSGIPNLSTAILDNLEAAKKDRWIRGASAATNEFLDLKNKLVSELVYKYAGISAANGLNPVPGVDIAVDLSVLVKLFKDIRNTYGLTDEKLKKAMGLEMPAVANLANNVVKYAAGEGIVLLLKQFASRQTVKSVSKYVPFVGQAIAATIGFAITKTAGKRYANDCQELAKIILKEKLSY